MDFLYNNASELNDSKKQLIKGTFYKCIRNKKMITLTDAAKELNLNKGFLSELENGKRHFPDGLDSLMNDLYHVSFSDNENNYFKCDNILTDAYNSFFDTNSEREKNILTTAVNENDYLEYSYSYFSFLIIKLFYYLRVIHNNSKVENYIKTIEKYTSAYSEYQLSIFYSLKGIYLKRNNRLIEYSIFAFQKSSLLCKAFSTVYAMNSFQLISLYAESNHLGIALKYCHTAKDVLRYKNNYWRLIDVDIFECNILTLLGEHLEAISNANQILKNFNNSFLYETGMIYQCLAMNYYLIGNYSKCMESILKVEKNPLFKGDISSLSALCFFKLKNYNQCLTIIKDKKKTCNSNTTLFLTSLKYLISNNDDKFKKYIFKCYKGLLQNNNFDDLYITLSLLLDYSIEVNNIMLQNQVLFDFKNFHEGNLTTHNSYILKSF